MNDNIKPRKRKSFHRKTNSQIFDTDEIFNPAQHNRNHSINANVHSNKTDYFSENINGNFNFEKITNVSFEEEPLNNSVIVNEEEKMKNKIEKSKSFIPLKNTLVYQKDKQENCTQSYLLALGLDKEEKDNDYNVASVIEEEKSDMLVSESDFSSKKKIFTKFNNMPPSTKKKLEDIHLNLNSILTNELINTDRHNQYNKIRTTEDDNKNDLSITINEMIKRKEEKEKKLRNMLTNNKKFLLNTFYTLGNNENANTVSNIDNTEKTNDLKENQSTTNTYKSSTINVTKKHVLRKVNSLGGRTSETSKEKKEKPEKKEKLQLLLPRVRPITSRIPRKTSHSKNSTLDLCDRGLHTRKQSYSSAREESRKENLASAISLINSNRNSKSNHTNSNTNNSSNNTYNGTRSNSHSSKSKEKPKVFKKTKSQCSFQPVLPFHREKEKEESNRLNIKKTLKYRLFYQKVYEKKDVIDKISCSSDTFYLIMCEKKKKGNLDEYVSLNM